MTKEEIMKRVEWQERFVNLYTRAINVGICPKCGIDMKKELYGDSEVCINKYTCSKCNKTYYPDD